MNSTSFIRVQVRFIQARVRVHKNYFSSLRSAKRSSFFEFKFEFAVLYDTLLVGLHVNYSLILKSIKPKQIEKIFILNFFKKDQSKIIVKYESINCSYCNTLVRGGVYIAVITDSTLVRGGVLEDVLGL